MKGLRFGERGRGEGEVEDRLNAKWIKQSKRRNMKGKMEKQISGTLHSNRLFYIEVLIFFHTDVAIIFT